MLEEMFRGRLEAGFNPLGYHFAGFNDYAVTFEFRKSDSPLRFGVKYGEGGVLLLWTENSDHDLLDRNIQQGVNVETFCGSPDEFWLAVKNIINSSN